MTRDQAITEAGRVFAEARAIRDALPPEQAALAAHVPGGPTVAEITSLIRRQRTHCHKAKEAV